MSSPGTSDIETGTNRNLYPTMTELRWGFIRQVYAILTVQLLFTVAVGALVVKFCPVFLDDNQYDWLIGLRFFSFLFTFKFLLLIFPLNHLLLAILAMPLTFETGTACSPTHGKEILEAVILTAVVVVSLTLFTFLAAKRGNDFNALFPFLFGATMALMVFALFRKFIFFPLCKITFMIYVCLAAIIFCGYVVYDTDNLIKGYTYDQYIWAAVSLYVDIINLLLLALLTVFRAADHEE